MNLQQATAELQRYLSRNYPQFSGTIHWEPLGRSFWVCRLRMPRGMAMATYSPLRGLTVFDSVSRLEEAGGVWKEFR